MTEEDKDNSRPKLRLSLEPKKPENAPATEPEKPNLQLRRPGAQPTTAEPQPPVETTAQTTVTSAPPDPATERLNEPENPLRHAPPADDTVEDQASPPKLPVRLAPAAESATVSDAQAPNPAQKEASEDAHHKKSLLISIVVIAGLLALLGACAYGLYYVLQSPSAREPASSAAEPQETATTNATESGNRLSQPIARAREVVAKIEDADPGWIEEIPTEPAEAAEVPAQESNSASPTQTPEPAPAVSVQPVDASQRNAVTEFLKQSHIGGVRMGERPKLLLNGLNYDPGDLIDPATGLRFMGLRDKKLVFQDAQGVVYIKSF